MKKCFSLLMVVCLVFGLSLPTFADTIEDSGFGITFTLPNTWTDVGDETTYIFENRRTDDAILIKCFPLEGAYSLDMLGRELVHEFYNEYNSDSALAQRLSAANDNAYITVTTNYTSEGVEYHNGVEYYKYEKIYTASAVGYDPTRFYNYCYITARNGALYFYEYERGDGNNNYIDFYNMFGTLSYEVGNIKININGGQIYSDSTPMIIQGRTMVPIRAVAEELGYNVGWDGAKQLVTMIGKDGTALLFTVGSDKAFKDSEEIVLEVAPFIYNGRTYLPLRAVAEAMDAEVNWDGETKTVEITR